MVIRLSLVAAFGPWQDFFYSLVINIGSLNNTVPTNVLIALLPLIWTTCFFTKLLTALQFVYRQRILRKLLVTTLSYKHD